MDATNPKSPCSFFSLAIVGARHKLAERIYGDSELPRSIVGNAFLKYVSSLERNRALDPELKERVWHRVSGSYIEVCTRFFLGEVKEEIINQFGHAESLELYEQMKQHGMIKDSEALKELWTLHHDNLEAIPSDVEDFFGSIEGRFFEELTRAFKEEGALL